MGGRECAHSLLPLMPLPWLILPTRTHLLSLIFPLSTGQLLLSLVIFSFSSQAKWKFYYTFISAFIFNKQQFVQITVLQWFPHSPSRNNKTLLWKHFSTHQFHFNDLKRPKWVYKKNCHKSFLELWKKKYDPRLIRMLESVFIYTLNIQKKVKNVSKNYYPTHTIREHFNNNFT